MDYKKMIVKFLDKLFSNDFKLNANAEYNAMLGVCLVLANINSKIRRMENLPKIFHKISLEHNKELNNFDFKIRYKRNGFNYIGDVFKDVYVDDKKDMRIKLNVQKNQYNGSGPQIEIPLFSRALYRDLHKVIKLLNKHISVVVGVMGRDVNEPHHKNITEVFSCSINPMQVESPIEGLVYLRTASFLTTSNYMLKNKYIKILEGLDAHLERLDINDSIKELKVNKSIKLKI